MEPLPCVARNVSSWLFDEWDIGAGAKMQTWAEQMERGLGCKREYERET